MMMMKNQITFLLFPPQWNTCYKELTAFSPPPFPLHSLTATSKPTTSHPCYPEAPHQTFLSLTPSSSAQALPACLPLLLLPASCTLPSSSTARCSATRVRRICIPYPHGITRTPLPLGARRARRSWSDTIPSHLKIARFPRSRRRLQETLRRRLWMGQHSPGEESCLPAESLIYRSISRDMTSAGVDPCEFLSSILPKQELTPSATTASSVTAMKMSGNPPLESLLSATTPSQQQPLPSRAVPGK